MSKETFADRLKNAMDRQHMKQVDLIREAEKAGVKLGKSHISQYVSGKTVPRAGILQFLARTLQVDALWLEGADTAEQAAEPEKPASADIDQKIESSGGRTMRTFKKSSKLDNVLYDVRGPVVDEAARMEADGTSVLKLNIGNPAPFGFRTPDEVIYDMRRQLTDCEGYSDARGLFFPPEKLSCSTPRLKRFPT